MTILATLATLTGTIMGFANVPQIVKIFRTRSAKDIAVSSYILLAIGAFIWILYGIEIRNLPILILNGLCFVEFCIIVWQCHAYGRR
ncbi:hypothetical protein COY28_05950 [Candidatus Woesearchaeota archaeon CG_4_10_14_0_2_um_filter_57_5]|nr:MAG: hypothetical protein AUJ68_06255 [Candidatus Woesearchaeota archaeon CG1_02_57_44]PIZ49913.1 MAG: hypothetical protein COY28_05950 [Candidatus Woesearchaeota archaeon CG_4_10_14_0_2_um_filter_57_5]